LKNLKISDFDTPCAQRTHAGISTSEIHFVTSKMVSAVRADARQKCPCPRTNPLAQTVYPLQGGKVHPNFEKKISGKIFSLHYDQKNTLIPLVKTVFESVDN